MHHVSISPREHSVDCVCVCVCVCAAGWEGAGLGAEEQGIQEPVKAGEVRDKKDKYKVRREEGGRREGGREVGSQEGGS